jgi:hypothetical protein
MENILSAMIRRQVTMMGFRQSNIRHLTFYRLSRFPATGLTFDVSYHRIDLPKCQPGTGISIRSAQIAN